MRKIIDTEIDRARSAAADEFARQAESLRGTGKAALLDGRDMGERKWRMISCAPR